MKRAMPIAIGAPITRAMADTQTVPQTNGATYPQKVLWPPVVPPARSGVCQLATMAGIALTIRKSATAARITMIRVAEPMLRPKKIRSSGRALDLSRTGPAPRGERGPVGVPMVTPGDVALAGEPVVLMLTDYFLAQA